MALTRFKGSIAYQTDDHSEAQPRTKEAHIMPRNHYPYRQGPALTFRHS